MMVRQLPGRGVRRDARGLQTRDGQGRGMTRVALALVGTGMSAVLVAGCRATASGTGGRDGTQSDSSAVAGLAAFADSILAAARARDPARFTGYFAPGDQLTYVINTRTLRSHAALSTAFRSLLGAQREFDVRWTDRHVAPLGPGGAVFTGGFQTSARDTSGAAWSARGVVTFAARREAAGWRVVQWHTSEVATTR
jgi:hypothetical protein